MDANLANSKLGLSSLCNRIGIPAGDQPQPAYLLTQLTPDPASTMDRLPLNVVVILDHNSLPMVESLPVFKQAVKDLIDQLQPADCFALVSLSGAAIIPSQPALEKAHLKRLIDKVVIVDETLSAKGLAEGLCQAQVHYSPHSTNRMVLILAGEIEADADELESLACQARASGVPISVIGYGNNWDDLRWTEVANLSCQAPPGSLYGMVEYAPSPDQVAEVMQWVYRSLHVVARDVSITFRFICGVEVRQVWSAMPTVHTIEISPPVEQAITLVAAELSQEGAAYLVEVLLPPRATGPARVAQIEATYTTAENTRGQRSVDLVVEFSQDIGSTNPLDSYVMNFVEMAQAHRLNIAALEALDTGNRQAAIQKFHQSAAILISQGYNELADRIRGEADYNIRQYGQISDEGRKMILLTGRRVVNPEAA